MGRKSKNIAYTYDSETDAVYIYFEDIQPGGVAKTIVLNNPGAYQMVNLDFDIDGKLLGIEILGTKKAKDLRFSE